jgi:hypothetical protein
VSVTGAPKFVRNFCVRFEVLTEDSCLLANVLLSICKVFVVSGPLQTLSSGSTKFENCIDLKTEVAYPSETSVTLPVRDNFSEDLNLLQEFFPLFFTESKPASGSTHSICCSFPSLNRILPGGDHLLPTSWVLKVSVAVSTLSRTYLWLSA